MTGIRLCTNCWHRPGRERGFDLDLSSVWWCDVCVYAAIHDRDVFRELADAARRVDHGYLVSSCENPALPP